MIHNQIFCHGLWKIGGMCCGEDYFIYTLHPYLFFCFVSLSVLWGLLSQTNRGRGMGNKWKFLSYWLVELPLCCMFIRHLCLRAPAVLEAYWLS